MIPPTICKCGRAQSYHGSNAPSNDDGHAYEPRYDPDSWREGYRAAVTSREARLDAERWPGFGRESRRYLVDQFGEETVQTFEYAAAKSWQRARLSSETTDVTA